MSHDKLVGLLKKLFPGCVFGKVHVTSGGVGPYDWGVGGRRGGGWGREFWVNGLGSTSKLTELEIARVDGNIYWVQEKGLGDKGWQL